jgi:DNA-binding protein YbaB
VDPDDIEMLQDLVVAAVNAAITEARKVSEEEMSKVTGGMNMPFKW